ncbi:helix-turn-helix transcriptional regulator [Paenibacillus sp. VCA1]|uniref:helix-turn-helix domain-containing protein n=1 Tax=Paenibacillus sp. VCA1 TaxID=3039148 RepID=UPI002871F057|nr:helix-turn-helix transcriptional regulator [Paenibacillus sp. VCA1]MDR9857830.1 helix-turn-helix transcriptional regulator [Paenibacillus sp. VCA1]
MLTLFGKFCRKLRIDNGELLKEMADKLNVTSSYLSAVETGKRNIPHDWLEKITNLYELDIEQVEKLKSAIEGSQLSVKIDLQEASSKDRNLVMSFAREFKELDENEKSKIWNILQRRNAGEVD